MKWILALLLCAGVAAAYADGFGASGFVQTTVGGGSGPTTCSPGALQFNLACNAINFVMKRE